MVAWCPLTHTCHTCAGLTIWNLQLHLGADAEFIHLAKILGHAKPLSIIKQLCGGAPPLQ